jgi:spore photoproduct lyase
MKTVNDIKAVIYDVGDEGNNIVKKFLSLGGVLKVPCDSEFKGEGYKSKEVIILKRFKGRFIQKCPGSPRVICCNYMILNTCFNCLYNCAYCYLGSYLNSFGITQFINTEELYESLRELVNNGGGRVYRIGTGEFTDSLMYDPLTGIGRDLIGITSPFKNVMLELKTKSGNVDHLLDVRERGSAVLSWSLNTGRNIGLYENDSASLDERLAAAGKASSAGYFTAFHFDPIIIYDGWMDDYKNTIDRLFREVDPEKIVWISLGGFRFMPDFRDVLRESGRYNGLASGEMFPGIDGKLRYLKRNRVNMYRTMKSYIEKHRGRPFIYLCMESADVWRSVFGREYSSSDDLDRDFSGHMKDVFLR